MSYLEDAIFSIDLNEDIHENNINDFDKYYGGNKETGNKKKKRKKREKKAEAEAAKAAAAEKKRAEEEAAKAAAEKKKAEEEAAKAAAEKKKAEEAAAADLEAAEREAKVRDLEAELGLTMMQGNMKTAAPKAPKSNYNAFLDKQVQEAAAKAAAEEKKRVAQAEANAAESNYNAVLDDSVKEAEAKARRAKARRAEQKPDLSPPYNFHYKPPPPPPAAAAASAVDPPVNDPPNYTTKGKPEVTPPAIPGDENTNNEVYLPPLPPVKEFLPNAEVEQTPMATFIDGPASGSDAQLPHATSVDDILLEDIEKILTFRKKKKKKKRNYAPQLRATLKNIDIMKTFLIRF